jgi:PAS domain-containing protein
MNKAMARRERVSHGQVEHRIIRRDGEVRTIKVWSNHVKDEDGRLLRAFGANQDVTERVQAEEESRRREQALIASKTKLSVAAKLANLGPWELNAETNIFEFDDEFYAIYGTEVAREGRFMPLEVSVREFVHPEDRWKVAEVRKKALASRSASTSARWNTASSAGTARCARSRCGRTMSRMIPANWCAVMA